MGVNDERERRGPTTLFKRRIFKFPSEASRCPCSTIWIWLDASGLSPSPHPSQSKPASSPILLGSSRPLLPRASEPAAEKADRLHTTVDLAPRRRRGWKRGVHPPLRLVCVQSLLLHVTAWEEGSGAVRLSSCHSFHSSSEAAFVIGGERRFFLYFFIQIISSFTK